MKSNGDRLTDPYQVRLTYEAESFIQTEAKKLGVSPGTFIRLFIIENIEKGGKDATRTPTAKVNRATRRKTA